MQKQDVAIWSTSNSEFAY